LFDFFIEYNLIYNTLNQVDINSKILVNLVPINKNNIRFINCIKYSILHWNSYKHVLLILITVKFALHNKNYRLHKRFFDFM
jgi:hypothetical protein